MLSFKNYLTEKKIPKPTGDLKDACWSGYTAVGMKMKNGRKVPNCVPEETELSEAIVKTQKYSWGTMKTIHHGSDFSIPLHPEHHQEIAKLGDEQEHKFKDETGRHWTARRKGEDVHFHSANDGPKTVVKHSALKEESELDEGTYNADVERAFPGGKASGVKTHPVAPVPDKKYIKGTPEHKAHKDAQKPRTGHPTGNIVDKSGAVHTPMSRARHLARMALQQQMNKEEVEQIDELSKSTLGSYVKKAALNRSQLSYSSGLAASRGVAYTQGIKKDSQRAKGISKAVGRLTSEEAEHIDELKDSTLQSYQAKRGNPEARKKTALAAMSDFFGARTGKAGAAHEKHGQGLERAHQKLEKSRIRQTAMNPQKPHNPPARKTGFRSGAEDDTYGT